jgi:hypothetical protein
MNDYQKKMLECLEKLKQILEDMPPDELLRMFEESKVTAEEISRYAVLEKMLRGETVDGWRLAGANKDE